MRVCRLTQYTSMVLNHGIIFTDRTQALQYSKTSVSKTTVPKNHSTQKLPYLKTVVLKNRSTKKRST